MNKKLFTILLVTVALALLLGACKMPASTAPKSTTAPSGELPFPVATTSDLVNTILNQTQTAIAGGVVGTPQPNQDQTQAPDDQTGGGQITPAPLDQSGGGNPTTEAGQTGGGSPTTEAGQTGGGAPTTEAGQEGGGSPVTQPTAMPTYVLPPEPTRPATYTLKQGEYPYCIARRYNIDPATLLSTNGLNNSSQIPAGYTLTLPAASTWTSSSRALHTHPSTFTARSGDTINSIACYFGDVYPEFIAAANGLAAPYTLTAGQVLQIP